MLENPIDLLKFGLCRRLFTCWSAQCENSSVGRARPCQGRGRGFESRFSLHSLVDWVHQDWLVAVDGVFLAQNPCRGRHCWRSKHPAPFIKKHKSYSMYVLLARKPLRITQSIKNEFFFKSFKQKFVKLPDKSMDLPGWWNR
jgi:hypothetical protein